MYLHVSLQIRGLSAWVVTAATLVRLLPSVGVGMGLQMTSCSAWVVTAATLERLLPSVDNLMTLETSCLGGRIATQVTCFLGLHPSTSHPPTSGLLDELVELICLFCICDLRPQQEHPNPTFENNFPFIRPLPFWFLFFHTSIHLFVMFRPKNSKTKLLHFFLLIFISIEAP